MITNSTVDMQITKEYTTIICESCSLEFIILAVRRVKPFTYDEIEIWSISRPNYCPFCGENHGDKV